MEQFVGKWNNTTSDNFDAYLKEVGVGMMTRTVASKLKPTLTFELNGDEMTMTSISTFKTHVTKFKLGVEFEDKTIDGRDVTAKFELEGGKLVHTEKGKNGGKDSRIERTIEGNKLTIVAECNGVKSVRVYEKV
ncbi:hypothetical protein PFISCL1PPCAC_2533 [Pristionchus fissidentatus]|uniref:Lipocalin/cytosolic fatty-acid binding domain-containing protein n=1 Tax=Pristionchus fissidentatus TaxID=1538716 RepID=A0AAV5UVB7_9BILA|nr:hypothetical protein PFISCL1PPCAC_2533 [Pristionchus fissidentatus]